MNTYPLDDKNLYVLKIETTDDSDHNESAYIYILDIFILCVSFFLFLFLKRNSKQYVSYQHSFMAFDVLILFFHCLTISLFSSNFCLPHFLQILNNSIIYIFFYLPRQTNNEKIKNNK